MGIEKLMEGNQTFVENEYAENIEYYKALLKGQNPHVMMIGCCDSESHQRSPVMQSLERSLSTGTLGISSPPETGMSGHFWSTGFAI